MNLRTLIDPYLSPECADAWHRDCMDADCECACHGNYDEDADMPVTIITVHDAGGRL